MPRQKLLSFLVAVSVFIAGTASAQVGDPEHGKVVFRKCKACHQVGDGAKNRVGPPLNDILDKPIAGAKGYKYSDALIELAQSGALWDFANLDAYLTKPRNFARGTKMSFAGLKKPQDRLDVVAYLENFSKGKMAEVASDGFVVAPEILALEGDLEYGEYLASECTTCHKISGENDGIPGIVGWDPEAFVTAMHSYREKHREHPVMQMVAGRLSNEEIAALAAFFEQLED